MIGDQWYHEVDCPEGDAAAGQGCVTPAGVRTTLWVHQSRVRLAEQVTGKSPDEHGHPPAPS